jgi:uncharacterized membrane protein
MNAKITLASILFIASIAIATVFAFTGLYTFIIPQDGTISNHPELTIYINGTRWENGVSYNWGTREAGNTYYAELNVTNSGNMPLQVNLTTTDLPATWNLEWELNGATLDIGQSAKANLELTIPSNATEWIAWQLYIDGYEVE